MILDAIGETLTVGDRVGTITNRRNPMILTGEVSRIGATMISATVLTAKWSGDPTSEYAHLPEVGSQVQLNAWRVFKLPGVVVLPVPELLVEDIRVETSQPGNWVKITHVPTGHTVSMGGRKSRLEAKRDALEALERLLAHHGKETV
jgi:hypothetical protein